MFQLKDKNFPVQPILSLFLLFVSFFLFYFLAFSTKNTNESKVHKYAYDIQKLGLEWLKNNSNQKGLLNYSFNPETDKLTSTNNELRQLMASRVLANEANKNPDFQKLHEKNLEFIFKYWYKEENDIAYIKYDGKSKLGANAMMLRTLVYSPDFEKYKIQANKLSNGIISLQNPDGSFEPWLIKPNYEYDHDYLLTFYSGEALLALLEYYNKNPDPKLLEKIKLSATFYINKYVNEIDKNYYPAYVPWHTMAYYHLYKITNEKIYADSIFKLNDKLLEIQDMEEVVGRFYNPKTPEYGSPHSSSDAVYLEGLAYAYEIAKLENNQEHQDKYRKSIIIAVQNINSLQYKNKIEFFKSDLEKYIGAIKVNKDSYWIRVDTTQHTIDAMQKILEIF